MTSTRHSSSSDSAEDEFDRAVDLGRPPTEVQLWALPIASGVVCIWICTEADSVDVGLTPDGINGEPLFSRRLFVSRQRVTVFAYRAAGFRDGGIGEYAYRRGPEKEEVRGRAFVRLADWSSPFVSNVVLLLISSLQESERVDFRPLGRFLRLASAWRVPHLFFGSLGDVRMVVLDLRLPKERHHVRVYAIGPSRVAVPDVEAVELPEGLCLLWRETDIFGGFLDLGTELLEFGPGTPAGLEATREWARLLGRRDRSRIVEKCLALLAEPDEDYPELLNDLLDPGETLQLAGTRWSVRCIASLPSGIFAFVGCDAPSDASAPRIQILVDGAEVELAPHRRLPTGSHQSLSIGETFVYRGDWIGHGEPRGPVRVSLRWAGTEDFVWVRLLGATTPSNRSLLRGVVPWGAADTELIEELYVPIAEPDHAGSLRWRLPAVEITPARSATLAGPLIMTFCDGDIEGLYRSVIGLGLSARDATATLRVFLRQELGEAFERDLSALCRDYGLACEIAALSPGTHLGSALGLTAEDRRRFNLSLLLSCGTAPGDAGWLGVLTSFLTEYPDAVWWGRPGQDHEFDPADLNEFRVADFALDRSAGVVALGHKTDDAVAMPHSQLLTFEAACLDVLSKAAGHDLLKVHPRIDFHRTSTRLADAEVLAEARLDQAILRSRGLKDHKPLRLVANRERPHAVTAPATVGKKHR